MSRPMSCGMKIQEFIPDAGTTTSMRFVACSMALVAHSTKVVPCATIVKCPWGNVVEYPNFVQAVVVFQRRRLLLPGLSYDMYYLGERVYEWELGPDQRRVPYDVLYYMLSTRFIQLEQDITVARRGSAATNYLATFILGAYAIFVRTQLLRDKHVRGGFDSRAPDKAVIVDKPEHGPGASFSFILDHIGQIAQGMLETHLVSPYQMSPPSCTYVSQLYEAARLKLALARLSSKHISRASMAPPASRGWGIQRCGHAGRGARRWPIIVKETEESGSEDLEEATSNMS
ncbi:hypothetical protein JCGZ_18210 [Jatropha curcas]|uniref:Uncharacterized protein n=1 Tax=Jatropha curcas TaxID=180498 RepID=A0A067K564_JATCU|nr:hypothetical protein JCGZ_18210 [Jatropha curcas]